MPTVALLVTARIDPACYYEVVARVMQVLGDDADVRYCMPVSDDFYEFRERVQSLKLIYEIVGAIHYYMEDRCYYLFVGDKKIELFNDVWVALNDNWQAALRYKKQMEVQLKEFYVIEMGIPHSKADEKKIKLRSCDCGLCDRCVGD